MLRIRIVWTFVGEFLGIPLALSEAIPGDSGSLLVDSRTHANFTTMGCSAGSKPSRLCVLFVINKGLHFLESAQILCFFLIYHVESP